MDESHKHYIEWKKLDINVYILYKSIYIQLKKQAQLICDIRGQDMVLSLAVEVTGRCVRESSEGPSFWLLI